MPSITGTSISGQEPRVRLRIERGDAYSVREFRTRQAAEAMRRDLLEKAARSDRQRAELRKPRTFAKAPGETHRTGDR